MGRSCIDEFLRKNVRIKYVQLAKAVTAGVHKSNKHEKCKQKKKLVGAVSRMETLSILCMTS